MHLPPFRHGLELHGALFKFIERIFSLIYPNRKNPTIKINFKLHAEQVDPLYPFLQVHL